jgi:hypothetical protein
MAGPTKGLGGVGVEVGGMDMEEKVKETREVMKRIDVLAMRPLVSHLICHRGFCDQRRRLEGTEIWVAIGKRVQ